MPAATLIRPARAARQSAAPCFQTAAATDSPSCTRARSATAAQRKIASYFNLQKNLQQWKTWIAANGHILTGLSVDAAWDNAASTQGKLVNFQPDTVRGGHAICVVGYTPNRFIIRNSWGPSWGDKGFGYASAQYINDAFFAESYGVSL